MLYDFNKCYQIVDINLSIKVLYNTIKVLLLPYQITSWNFEKTLILYFLFPNDTWPKQIHSAYKMHWQKWREDTFLTVLTVFSIKTEKIKFHILTCQVKSTWNPLGKMSCLHVHIYEIYVHMYIYIHIKIIYDD